jgi:SAM-dependent methyltransferase
VTVPMSDLDHWNERFAAAGYLFGTQPNAFLASQAHRLAAGTKALSIADGEGRNGVFLAERGLDVLAVDFSPVALAKSRELATSRGVTLRTEQADILGGWSWPNAEFDVVVAIFIQFATAAEQPRLFANIKQALKPGGLLIMQGYRPEQLAYATGGPKIAGNLYTRALLEAAFVDFASLDIREHDDVVNEGSGHNGMSALIDLVGRK